jgi:hypothetical protein
MPKAAIPLNEKRIKALKPKAERHLIADGGGLEVMTCGSMVWRYLPPFHWFQQFLSPKRAVS